MKTNISAYSFKYSQLILSIITFAGLQINTAFAKTASIGSAVNWGNVDTIVVNRQAEKPSVAEVYFKKSLRFFDHPEILYPYCPLLLTI